MSTFDREAVKVTSTLVQRHLDLARVRVDERGLWLDEALVLARADVASVALELDERTSVHVLDRDGKSVSCDFTSVDDARALVEAFGRAPDRTMIEVALVPSLLSAGFGTLPWWRASLTASAAVATWLVALLLMTGRAGFLKPLTRHADLSGMSGWATAFGIVAALTATLLFTRDQRSRRRSGDKRRTRADGALSQTMKLGADGVQIEGALANDFVAYADIRAVSSRDESLVLTLRDGREAISQIKVPSRMPEILARIRSALDEEASPVDEDVVALLRVPGTKHARVAALRELASEEGATYRDARIPREHLWALVEGSQADGVTRSRAAVALSANLADEDRERLRAATNATASPRVRIAMDAIEHGDHEGLAEKLDELEADEEPSRGRSQAHRER